MNIKDIISESSKLRLEVANMNNPAITGLSTQVGVEKPKVAVWGILNAGKSSLLNMLTSHIKEEYFQTGDHRVTTSIKEFEDEYAVYIDTPGLDANDKDTEEAMLGMKQADIIIFVHQIPGELEKQEIDFLEKLVQSFGKYANSNIIIALTKIDQEGSNPEKVNQIEHRVAEQCKKIGFSPKIFQISNKRFKKGREENKQTLIKNSHIIELQQTIGQILSNGSNNVQNERAQQEINERTRNLLRQLRALKKQLKTAIDNEKSELATGANFFDEFTKEMNKLIDFINQKDKEACKN